VTVVAAQAEGEGRQAVVLVAEPACVSAARAWLTGAATGLIHDDRRGSLELVISEIVTNAVRHGRAGGEILLAATPKPGFLCVQVTDGGAGFAPRPGAMASDENGGYGLFLVERLTRRWGITRENARTRVWFEFDYDEA
jgi:anti-sigma regulatory factor (Ser/Thr protein kinase)